MLTKLAVAAAALAGSPAEARLHAPQPDNATLALNCASGPSRCAFAHALLSKLGYPTSQYNLISLAGWMQAEGSPCAYNPLDSTESYPGATNCNSVGVKNYPSYNDGIAATIKTLQNGYYNAILAALHASDVPTVTGQAIASSKWGTGKLALECITDAYDSPSIYTEYASKNIAE